MVTINVWSRRSRRKNPFAADTQIIADLIFDLLEICKSAASLLEEKPATFVSEDRRWLA
jgi:hypothetical protein